MYTQEQIDRALRAADTSGIFGPLPGVTFYPFESKQQPMITLRPQYRRGPMGPKLAVLAVWLLATAGILALRYWPTKSYFSPPIAIDGIHNPKFQSPR